MPLLAIGGSLSSGTKFKTGGPFDPSDWDVDAFIVSDVLANKFPESLRFRAAEKADPNIKKLSEDLENSFKEMSGYRSEPEKEFTFRVYTQKEFNNLQGVYTQFK